MAFYFSLYDSGVYWDTGGTLPEIDMNRYVIDEVWQCYGHHKSFRGWYLTHEISRRTKRAIEAFSERGKQCKQISGGLPALVSPWMHGRKAVDAKSGSLT